MNVWIQIGALLAFTAAVLFALACCCYAGAKFFSDLGEGYGALFKHAKKVPRFGMGALFLFVSVFAVASAIFRWLAPSGPVGTVFAAVAALVLAAGVVCSVKCVLDDVYANWSRRPPRLEHQALPSWQMATDHEKPAEPPRPSVPDGNGPTPHECIASPQWPPDSSPQ